MEVTYEALENANISLQDIWGTQTTCYIGSTVSDYRDALIRDFMQTPKYHLLGTGEEMISNRISHFLNIHGPSATLTTACSSSLVATHMSVQSIKSGEVDMAITGGVGLMLTPDYTTVSIQRSPVFYIAFRLLGIRNYNSRFLLFHANIGRVFIWSPYTSFMFRSVSNRSGNDIKEVLTWM